LVTADAKVGRVGYCWLAVRQTGLGFDLMVHDNFRTRGPGGSLLIVAFLVLAAVLSSGFVPAPGFGGAAPTPASSVIEASTFEEASSGPSPIAPPLLDSASTPEDSTGASTFAPEIRVLRSAQAAAIEALLAQSDGLCGVVLLDEDGTSIYQQNADLPLVSASLYKLVLLADILKGIEDGVLDYGLEVVLTEDYFPADGDFEDSYFPISQAGTAVPVEDLLFATGAYSSNVAALALRSLTSRDDLEAMARTLEMESTWFFMNPDELTDWPPDRQVGISETDYVEALSFIDAQAADGPVSITTAGDVGRFLTRLLNGEVVSGDVSNEIIDILKEQVVVDRIPFLLPADTEIAHKTGNLDHVVHDVGIIWAPTGPVILVAMLEDAEDDTVATELIRRLALIAYGETEPPVPEGTPDVVTLD
jgi:beta-lactamase class A